MFSKFKNLQDLTLNRNCTKQIEPNAFANLSNLKNLYFAGNELKNIPSEAFGNIQKFELLDLLGNPIKYVRDDDFLNLPNLRHLYMEEYNRVRNHFKRLSKLVLLRCKAFCGIHPPKGRVYIEIFFPVSMM
jgi:hypothetical protein